MGRKLPWYHPTSKADILLSSCPFNAGIRSAFTEKLEGSTRSPKRKLSPNAFSLWNGILAVNPVTVHLIYYYNKQKKPCQ